MFIFHHNKSLDFPKISKRWALEMRLLCFPSTEASSLSDSLPLEKNLSAFESHCIDVEIEKRRVRKSEADTCVCNETPNPKP